MKNRPYELIEHTADIGVRVRGKDLKELFRNSAQAMFSIIAEKKSKRPTLGVGGLNQKSKITIKQKADNLEELFINWLNELLFLSATKEIIFYDFKIAKLDENNLEAVIFGSNMRNYKVNTEIKAATYHELKIERKNSGFQAQIIFDV